MFAATFAGAAMAVAQVVMLVAAGAPEFPNNSEMNKVSCRQFLEHHSILHNTLVVFHTKSCTHCFF